MGTAKVRGCPDTGVSKLPTEREKRVESSRRAIYSRRFCSCLVVNFFFFLFSISFFSPFISLAQA